VAWEKQGREIDSLMEGLLVGGDIGVEGGGKCSCCEANGCLGSFW
jgi:hypothetical protein